MQCTECHKSLIELSKRVFTCETCSTDPESGDAVYWCKKCFETTEHEHKRIRHKGQAEAKEKDGDEADEET